MSKTTCETKTGVSSCSAATPLLVEGLFLRWSRPLFGAAIGLGPLGQTTPGEDFVLAQRSRYVPLAGKGKLRYVPFSWTWTWQIHPRGRNILRT